MLCDLIL